MTVEQLIEKLRAFPPDTVVWCDGDRGDHEYRRGPHAGRLVRCDEITCEWCLTRDTDGTHAELAEAHGCSPGQLETRPCVVL